MEHHRREGFKYLSEGNRDKVLEEIRHLYEDEEVLWMMANSVISNEERIEIFTRIAQSKSKYGEYAARVIAFEKDIENKLLEPPKYQFWKKTLSKISESDEEKKTAWYVWFTLAIVILIFIGGLLFLFM